MEIPDVIAINKMDSPAAKTMLNEVRSILALGHGADWDPPIVLTEAIRGENVPELWEKIEEHRAFLTESGQLEERRRANLAREVFAVAASRAGRHLERAVTRRSRAEAPARRGSGARARPAHRGARDTREGLPNPMTAPALAEIERAREVIAGVARVTPVYPTETFSRLVGRPVLLEGRVPAADGLVQGARRVHEALVSRAGGARRGRRRRERGQPRPGRRVGGARARRARARVHAAGLADGEGRRDAQLRRRGRARRPRDRGLDRGRDGVRRGDGRHVHPPVRGSGDHLRPGHDRPRDRRAG